MGQIEVDKNELFEKITVLEEENEQHLKEKHSLKVELMQTKTVLSDTETQLKRAREHIGLLDSLNNFKEEELKEIGDLSKESENMKAQFSKSQKTLAELRYELEEVEKKKQLIQQQNIQLSEDLSKERLYSGVVKQELKDLKTKYLDNVEQKKAELGLSNIAASKMFTYYKMRESINNRLSALNMPVSFAGEENSETGTHMKGIGENRVSHAERASTAPNRMSLRNSIMQSSRSLLQLETVTSVSS